MKQEKVSLQQRRNMIIKNSIIMLVLLVVIFLATMSWFTVRKSYKATGINIMTEEPEIVQFALPDEEGSYPADDEAYVDHLQLEDGLADIFAYFDKDVTSDGLNFFLPTLKYSNGLKVVDDDKGWTKAINGEDYVSVDFYVRSNKSNLYVSENSYLAAGSTKVLTKELSTSQDDSYYDSYDRVSPYGNFSADGIVGAMRVSLVQSGITDETTGAKSCNFLWIPRPDLYLDGINELTLYDGVLKDYIIPDITFEKGSTYEHNYYYPSDESEANAISGNGMTEKTYEGAVASVVEEQVSYAGYTPLLGENYQVSDATMVASDVTIGEETYYIYKYTLNIWIEGTDAEARRALNGGVFNLCLKFNTGEQ